MCKYLIYLQIPPPAHSQVQIVLFSLGKWRADSPSFTRSVLQIFLCISPWLLTINHPSGQMLPITPRSPDTDPTLLSIPRLPPASASSDFSPSLALSQHPILQSVSYLFPINIPKKSIQPAGKALDFPTTSIWSNAMLSLVCSLLSLGPSLPAYFTMR